MTVLAAGGDRHRHVAGAADAAVGDQGTPVALGDLGAVEDGGELGHTDPGDQAGGAAKPGPIPTLTASAPASARSRKPSAVATLPATTSLSGQVALSSLDGLDGVVRVAVGDVDDQGVDVGVEQGLGPFQVAAADPEGGCDPQAALAVAGRLRPAVAQADVAQVISPASRPSSPPGAASRSGGGPAACGPRPGRCRAGR